MATIKIIKLSTIPNEFSSHIGMGPKKFQKGIRNPFVSAKGIRNLLLLAYVRTLMPHLLKQNLIKLQKKIY